MSGWLWFIIANGLYLFFVAVCHAISCITHKDTDFVTVTAMCIYVFYALFTLIYAIEG